MGYILFIYLMKPTTLDKKKKLVADGRRIRELTSLVQKRFGYSQGQVELLGQKVNFRGLCAASQAESLRFKLLGQYPVRMAAMSIIRFVMKSGATGCEVVVSGKLRAQRAKSME